MTSYSDVVSGSGKFIFGVYCNCLRAILPNHVQSFISLRIIGLRVRVRVVVQVTINHCSFCDLLWVDHQNKKPYRMVVLNVSKERPP